MTETPVSQFGITFALAAGWSLKKCTFVSPHVTNPSCDVCHHIVTDWTRRAAGLGGPDPNIMSWQDWVANTVPGLIGTAL